MARDSAGGARLALEGPPAAGRTLSGRAAVAAVRRAAIRAAFVAALCLTLPGAVTAKLPGEGLHYPTDTAWNADCDRVEKLIDEGDWAAVEEGLLFLFRKLESLRPASAGASVVPAGDGYAAGLAASFQRILGLVAPDTRARFIDAVDPLLRKEWQALADTPEARRRWRHVFLRDYPWSSLRVEAALEEIDHRLLSGDLDGAARLSAAIRSSDGLGAARRAQLALVLRRAAELRDDRGAFDRAGAALGETAPETLPPSLTEAVTAALERPYSPPAPRGSLPRSPLVLRSPAADLGEGRYSLGSIQGRKRFELSELAHHLARRLPSSLPVAPALSGSKTPASRDLRATDPGDFPIPFLPLARGDRLYVQTYQEVLAFSLPSLAVIWSAPLGSTAFEALGAAVGPALAADRIFAASGERVVCLDEESGAILWRRAVRYDRKARALRAADDDDGGPRGAEETPGAVWTAATLTSPAPFSSGVVLGVAVKIENEILVYALALDGRGETSWSTYLGSTQTTDHLGQGATMSPPLVHGGRLYQLTNIGALACLDPADGAILWLQSYDRLSDRGKARAIDDWNRWQPNPLAVWRDTPGPAGALADTIIAAPQDTDRLVAFDAGTGALRWELPRDRSTTIAGLTKDGLILGGPRVQALRLRGVAAPEPAWTWTPESGQVISVGRPCVQGDAVYVSDLNALYTVDVDSGRTRATALWDYRGGGGNLLILPTGQLAVASPGGYFVYSHLEEERRRIALLPRDSESSFLEKARLDLKSGDVAAALDALRAWRARGFAEPPPNSELDHLLFQISELLRYSADIEGPEAPWTADLLQTLFLTERLPELRAVAAFRCAEAHLRRNAPRAAVEILREALEKDLGNISCPVDDALAVPGRVVAESLLERIRQSGPAGEAALREFEWTAQERLAAARRQGTLAAFQRVVRGFPRTQAAAQAHLELASLYQDQQNIRESREWLLQYLRHFPKAADYTSIALRAAELSAQLGSYSEARDLLLALLAERADDKIEAGERRGLGQTVRAFVERRLREPGFSEIEVPASGRYLSFPVELLWRAPANLLTTRRQFLEATGEPPPALRQVFLTFSKDLLECRDVATGRTRWQIEFGMLPGFKSSPFYSGSQRPPRAIFHGDRLYFHDLANILAIDAQRGSIVWQHAFERLGDAEDGRFRMTFQSIPEEQIVSLAVGAAGVYVRTNQNRLLRFGHDGKRLLSVDLPFNNTRYKGEALLRADGLVLFRQAPIEVVWFDPESGQEKRALDLGIRYPDASPRLLDAIVVGGDRVALLSPSEVFGVDLAAGKLLSRFRAEGLTLESAWPYPAYDGQVIVHGTRNGQMALTGVNIARGVAAWQHEGFKTARPGGVHRPEITIDDTRLFVLHGGEYRALTALDVLPGAERESFAVVNLWKEPLDLGMIFGREIQIIVTHDALIHPDPVGNSISIVDKRSGEQRNALSEPMVQFLADKRLGFHVRHMDGLLVFLTDRGDGGFASRTGHIDLAAERRKVEHLERYLARPTDWDAITYLAMEFFRERNYRGAIQLLNDALLSEHLPSLESPGKYQDLKALLDGIKQEAIKELPEEIVCRRFRVAPTIDGALEESWNLTHMRRLEDLRSINDIPAPGQELDIWKGEEDLSARLYTGWDETYFYFALDVQDNRIYPYDKEAPFWKGDCLLIGLDPEGDGGLYQNGRDQLLTLALTVPKRNARKEQGEQGEEEEEDDAQKPEGKYSVKKKDDDSGVVYEAAIPWSSFADEFRAALAGQGLLPPGTATGYTPAAGKRFGLSLVVTDDDTGQGASKSLSINPCHLLPRDQASRSIWRHLVPEYFPKVKLE